MKTTLNFCIPESLRLYINMRSKEGGYGSVSEYLRDLIRADQRRHIAKIDKEIEQGKIIRREIFTRRH